MDVLLPILLIILVIPGVKLFSPVGFNDKYLDRYQTTCVNGIFIVLVFLSHSKGYLDYSGAENELFRTTFNILAQGVVVTFLFYSGFGVSESIKSKGIEYSKGLPKKIISLLARFDIAILVFWIVQSLLNIKSYSITDVLWAMTTIGGIGNSNWFITSIVLLYLSTFISRALFKNELTATLFNILLVVGLIYVHIYLKRPMYTYNTMLSYTLGLLYSIYKDHITNFLKNGIVYATLSILTYIIGFKLYNDGLTEISNYIAYMLIFNVAVILITSRVEVGNDLLYFFGKYLFPLYIFQRVPMLILQNEGINNNIVFLITAGLATIIIAVFMEDFVFSKIDNLIYRSK